MGAEVAVSDSSSIVLILAVAVCAYLFGHYRRGEADLREQLERERERAAKAEQRLSDVLAIPLPKGYGEAIGASPRPQDTYEREQAALLRANFDSD